MRAYWKLKAVALDSTLRRTRFGRDYGLVAKTDYEMNESDIVLYTVRRVSFESFDDGRKFSCSPLQTTSAVPRTLC